ncbi:MAG: response regulator [Burkholderiales bacterium]|nr:response regulator [Burkholderiales bacterium]
MSAPEVAPALPRILIVDDSRIVRASIARQIRARFAITEAVDGEEGWARLREDASIRAVISDLAMPKLDGFALLTRIRTADDARLRAMPVVIISGDDEGAQMKRAARLGATDFITKGIAAVELVSRLENLTALTDAREKLDTARATAAQTATTDPVTQVGTMSLLIKHGAAMFSYARRHRVPLAVVRVALDDFAALRERIGERVADQILTAVAKLLTSRLRKEDVVARTDVAEFAIAAPAASSLAALKFSRRLADDIRGARITWRGKRLTIGAAIGIADSTHAPAHSFADVFALAGRRLERARARDDDRVVFEDEAAPAEAPPPAPSIEEALALLAAGQGGELRAHVAELALRIFPLVKFCDDQFTAAERERVELAITQRLSTLKEI